METEKRSLMERVEHAAKNLKFSMASEMILAILKFISRKIFVIFLGKEYLGINGLFTDILSMLSLAELGFGVSITYSLYRPAAQNDDKLIKSLMRLYRRVYQAIGTAVLASGILITPFLGFFVKEMPENIPHIPLIYILNVINVGISYFFSYKSTLLFVYQKKYIDGMIRAGVMLVSVAAQAGVLFVTGNYLYYLFTAIAATLLQNILIYLKTDRLYPYLREKDVDPLPSEIMQEIRRNMGAMILHRMGAVVVFGTDNILISKFVGVAAAGLYSNYTLIRNFLNTMVNALFNVFTPALGNLNAMEGRERRREAFRQLHFFAAWLFGWLSICLLWLYDPFITIWLGEGYLLPKPVVLLIVVNFYVNGMRIPVANTKSVMGLFWDERYKSILEAFSNLVISVILAKRWGILGIIAGTLASTVAFPFWIEPLGLYRHGLKLPVREYFFSYVIHLSVTVAAGALTGLLCQMAGGDVFGFLLRAAVCGVVPNVVYLVFFGRTKEFLFLKNMIKRMVCRLLKK